MLRASPLSQRGASLLELVLILMVTLSILVTIFVAYTSARESADVADLREALMEVTTAARSARPSGNYTALEGQNALSSLGRFAPNRLTDTGAVRGPGTSTLRIEATPSLVIPAAQRPAATGKTPYFDVVVDTLTPPLCVALVRAIQADRWPRIQIGDAVYADRLVSPIVEPATATLDTTTFCYPTGTQQVTLRLTSA